MRFYNYRKNRCQRVFILLAFLILIIAIGVYLLSEHIENILLEAFEDKVKQNITEISNRSVLEVLENDKVSYNDMVLIDKNNSTTLIKINTIYVNKLMSKWILSINQKIRNLMPISISFRSGYLFKNFLFYDAGPVIKGKILYASAVSYNLKSEFLSAGINQTIHRLYMILNFEVSILFLSRSKSLKITQKVPIAENIYIGEVPKVYIGK